mmetsp:Transcript_79307/g.250545  ORF Transcript_79307/g.250545 Transcript_79307/m.250545 type:complete len:253 (+) Transcript_79307:242-1000(+)
MRRAEAWSLAGFDLAQGRKAVIFWNCDASPLTPSAAPLATPARPSPKSVTARAMRAEVLLDARCMRKSTAASMEDMRSTAALTSSSGKPIVRSIAFMSSGLSGSGSSAASESEFRRSEGLLRAAVTRSGSLPRFLQISTSSNSSVVQPGTSARLELLALAAAGEFRDVELGRADSGSASRREGRGSLRAQDSCAGFCTSCFFCPGGSCAAGSDSACRGAGCGGVSAEGELSRTCSVAAGAADCAAFEPGPRE